MVEKTEKEIRERFEIYDGQFFAEYRYKNLQWDLNGRKIGYGDLRDEDILRISETLEEGEEFVGWNEHHGGPHQQTNTPMVRITREDIKLRTDIVEEEGH